MRHLMLPALPLILLLLNDARLSVTVRSLLILKYALLLRLHTNIVLEVLNLKLRV